MRWLVLGALLLAGCERTAPSPSAASSAAPPVASPAPPPEAPAPSASARPPTAADAKFLQDLNAFCIATQQVKADASIPADRRAAEIVGRLVASQPSPAFLRALTALGDRPTGERYQALKQAAAERGATAWACPSLAD